MRNLLRGAQGETVGAGGLTIERPRFVRGLFTGLLGGGRVIKANGSEAGRARQRGGDLQKALGADEVGLEGRPEGIATPSHAGDVAAGAAQQGVVEDGAKGSAGFERSGERAADDAEDLRDGQTILGEQAVGGSPIFKLRAGGGQQTGNGMASETK